MAKTNNNKTTVGEYLQSLRNLVSDSVNKATSNALESSQKAATAQILEILATRNALSKDKNRPAEIDTKMLRNVKSLETLVKQLLSGKNLSEKQQEKLDNVSKVFYDALKGYEINSEKLIKEFSKVVTDDLPESINKRITNDIETLKKREKEGKITAIKDEDEVKYRTSSFKILKNVANDLAKGNKLSAMFRSNFSSMFEVFAYNGKNLLNAILDKLPDKKTLTTDLLKLGLIFAGTGLFGKLLSGTGDFLKNVTKMILYFPKQMATFGNHLTKFGWNIIKWLVKGLVLNQAGPLGTLLFPLVDSVFKNIENFVSKLTDKIPNVFKNIFKKISNFIKPVLDWVINAGIKIGKFLSFLKPLGQLLKPILNLTGKLINPVLKLGGKLGLASTGIGTIISVVWDIVDFIKGFASTDGNFFEKLWGGFKETFIGSLVSMALNIGKWVDEKLLSGFFTKKFEAVKTQINTAWNTVTSVFGTIKDKLANAVSQFFINLGSLIELKIKDLWNNVKNWFKKLIPGFNESESVLLNPLSDEKHPLLTKITEIFDDILNKRKSEKGAGSGTVISGGSTSSAPSGSSFGEKLARIANKRKVGTGFRASRGKCGLYVGNALAEAVTGNASRTVFRGNGKDWASGLNSSIGKKYFTFAGMRGNGQLSGLPAGSILSWPASKGHPYGHVEIADGHNNLISDFSRPASSILYKNMQKGLKAYTFIPKGVDLGPDIPDEVAASPEFDTSLASTGTTSSNNSNYLNALAALAKASSSEDLSATSRMAQGVSVTAQDGLSVSNKTFGQILSESATGVMHKGLSTMSNKMAQANSLLPKLIPPVYNSDQPGVRRTEIDDTDIQLLQSIFLS